MHSHTSPSVAIATTSPSAVCVHDPSPAKLGSNSTRSALLRSPAECDRVDSLRCKSLTFHPASMPESAPDGMSVTYTGANQRDQMIQPVDRSSAERVLFTPPSLAGDGSWTHTADGDVVAIATDTGDVWLWSPPEGKPRPLIQTPFSETSPAFSPDGRWLAYTSMQTSAAEIWVQPFPNKGKAVQVSVSGGSGPAWGPSGRELFYLQGDTLMAVSVTTTQEFSRSPPKRLLDLSRYNLEGRSARLHRRVREPAPIGRECRTRFGERCLNQQAVARRRSLLVARQQRGVTPPSPSPPLPPPETASGPRRGGRTASVRRAMSCRA